MMITTIIVILIIITITSDGGGNEEKGIRTSFRMSVLGATQLFPPFLRVALRSAKYPRVASLILT